MTGPNEQRTISREYFGFYKTLVIGGIYEFTGSHVDIRSSRSFYGAVKKCVDQHPTLSVVVRDMDTDVAFFERVSTLIPEDHISIIEDVAVDETIAEKQDEDEMKRLEARLPNILDQPWPSSRPPWKIVVLPISAVNRPPEEPTRCFIGFAFSHALGDGISALAFHRTFNAGIFERIDKECSTFATPESDFPAPFDTKKNFSISWGFLLAPLIAVYLPKFIAEFFGLRASVSIVSPETWTGTKMFFEPEVFNTCLRVIEIPSHDVENALRAARKNQARLTGALHQSITRGLSLALPREIANKFASGTAVNMRRAIGKSDNEMGLYVNACYNSHERDDVRESPWSRKAWDNAQAITEKLATAAVTLHDQPVGLLRYVPSIKKWTAGKIGQERDCSYELSNLGAFDATTAHDPVTGARCKITHIVFTRPADATAPPVSISVASVKGGSMVITISWQSGAFGIAPESESAAVESLCDWLKEDLKRL